MGATADLQMDQSDGSTAHIWSDMSCEASSDLSPKRANTLQYPSSWSGHSPASPILV